MEELVDSLVNQKNLNKYNEKPPKISENEIISQTEILEQNVKNDLTFDFE